MPKGQKKKKIKKKIKKISRIFLLNYHASFYSTIAFLHLSTQLSYFSSHLSTIFVHSPPYLSAKLLHFQSHLSTQLLLETSLYIFLLHFLHYSFTSFFSITKLTFPLNFKTFLHIFLLNTFLSISFC